MVAIAIGREFNPRRRLILFLYFAFFPLQKEGIEIEYINIW